MSKIAQFGHTHSVDISDWKLSGILQVAIAYKRRSRRSEDDFAREACSHCNCRSGLQQHRELEIFYLSIETQLSVAGSSIFVALCERALSKRV